MIKDLIRSKLKAKFPGADFDILVPPSFGKASAVAKVSADRSEGKPDLGDYSTNIAFVTTETRNKTENPEKVAEKLAKELRQDEELADVFDKVEAVKPGFVNFYLKDDFVRTKLGEIAEDKNYGFNETMKGQTVMIEYTNPNPFKLFHIGHLMSNAIGEAISRLYEASGAKVLRANYQGDVGLHVAKAIWGMINMEYGIWNMEHGKPRREAVGEPTEASAWNMEQIGEAYAKGAKAYEEDEDAKKEIEEINNKIYDRSDSEINEVYDLGKKLSLEYFETIYKKLGTKFDRYFFESEAAVDGLNIVEEHPDVFVESSGAKVFMGEEYGLHTRVFVSAKGLPTYEAKELGVNQNKFEKDKLDLSVIVTGNEINEYFRVLLKVMELTMPEVAARTKHISHGMLRLPGGKMSSRTGDVITADSLIEQTEAKLPESEDENTKEKIAIGAIKYSILKQSPGRDIVFDFEKSLSVKGDSGPYLQYTFARLNSILNKAEHFDIWKYQSVQGETIKPEYLTDSTEIKLIKRLLMFPDVVNESSEKIFPQHLARYLYELANDANRFYESVRVLGDEDENRRNARLVLISVVSSVLKRGLNLLGIEVLERI